MAEQASLIFRINAEDQTDAAMRELKGDLSALDTQIKAVGRSIGLLPSESRQLVSEFAKLETESEQVAFAMAKFNSEGLEMLPRLQQLASQSQRVEQQFAQLSAQTKAVAPAVKEAANEFKGLGDVVSQHVPAFSQLNALMSSGVGAFAAVGAAVAAVAVGMGKAVEQTVTLGSAFNDLSLQTGITVEDLSAMQLVVARGGGSLEGLANAYARFQRSAVEGSEEARAAFAQFGVDISTAVKDPQRALQEIAKAFVDMGPSAERTAATMAIFGRGAAEMAPQMYELARGFKATKDEAADLGILWKTETAQQSDVLGDNFGVLSLQLQAISKTVAENLLPGLIKLTDIMSSLLGLINKFPTAIDAIVNALLPWKEGVEAIGRAWDFVRNIATKLDMTPLDFVPDPTKTKSSMEATAKGLKAIAEQQDYLIQSHYKKAKATKEDTEAEREREKAAKAAAAALKAARDELERDRKARQEQFMGGLQASYDAWFQTFSTLNETLEAEDKARYDKRFERLEQYGARVEYWVERLGTAGMAAPDLTELGAGTIFSTLAATAPAAQTAIDGIRFSTDAWADSMAQSVGLIDEMGNTQTATFGFMKEATDVLWDSFDGLAKAIGSSVAQWVLYGQTGPAALRKMLAATLAQIAAEATWRAIEATALGFLRLAQWDAGSASQAFASAALWASLAGGAAIVGRAIAPGNEQEVGAQGSFGGPPPQINIGTGQATLGASPQELFATAASDLASAVSRINSMPAGDVLVLGAGERPEGVAIAFAESARRGDANIRSGLADAGVR